MAKLKILGDWKGAREALLKTERGIKRLSYSAKSVFGKIGGMFSSMLSPLGFGLGGLGAATVFTTIVNRLDDIGKASSRMGVSAEYFQKMRYAAERTGSEITQVSEAFGKVLAQVGKLMSGDAGAKSFFASMGLSKEDLAGLSPEQTFDRVNRAIAAIGNEQERNAVKSRLYGESFLKLNNFLKDYIELGDEAKSRGLIIDDKTIKAAEGLKDAMTNAGTAFMAALAGSGAVEWLNDVAQNLDAAANIDRLKQDAGVKTRDTRSGFRRWAESAWGIGGFIGAANKKMFGLGEEAYTPKSISYGPHMIQETPELFQGIGGKDKLADYLKAIDEAKNSITDITNKERVYINNSGSFEEVEKRKAELLKKRKEAATAAEKIAQQQKEFDVSQATAQSVLGSTSLDEQKMLDEAQTAEEVYAALDKITDAREKQKKLSEQRLADLDKELKYQRMILDGKAREVEIEKALEREAKAQGVDVSKLDPATAERIRNAAGAMYDLKNPAAAAANIPPIAQAPFPTDSLRRVGGMSGAIASSVSGVNYAKSSAESLKRVETTLSNIDRNTAANTGLSAP
ncbi:MAG: hypothetical protein WCS62_05595 [Bacilli bacterium]